MSDTSPVNRTGRAVILVTVLVYCFGLITWLMAYGNPQNSLHQSALSWACTIVIIDLAALVVGAFADYAAAKLKSAP